MHHIMIMMSVLIMLFWTTNLYAQEEDLFGSAADDSLLFGSEFDLSGDDFSFDFDDADTVDSSAGDTGDFFGESAEANDSTPADTSLAGDDWGLGDDSNDLFADDSTKSDTLLEAYSDHPLDFRKRFHGTLLEDTGLTVSFYSPQYVSAKMDTWYSYMDYSFSIELPWHYDISPANLSFLVDISSFNFKNSFPAGGIFNGVSFMPTVRAEVFGFEVETGVGMYLPTFGVMAGLGYSFQYHSVFVSAGYRWNWAYNIDPIGSGWWAEPRFTTGIKLW